MRGLRRVTAGQKWKSAFTRMSPNSLYLHLSLNNCKSSGFKGILTDWCCHADAVTGSMLDGLVIYEDRWDAQNGTWVNVHLFWRTSSGGLPTSRPDPAVEGTWLTDWLCRPPAKPTSHRREGAHALPSEDCEQTERRGGGWRLTMLKLSF